MSFAISRVRLLVCASIVALSIAGEVALSDTIFQGPNTAIGRTRAMIELAFEDLSKTYSVMGGGGIFEVKQLRTLVFRVALSQEERVDTITYTFELDNDGKPKIVSRETGVLD